MRGELEGLARELGIAHRVRFLGSVPNDRVHELIYAADVAVFPSLAEATSIACLEAMACGTTVIVSDVGGLPEIVRDGETGIVVPFQLPASTFRDPGLPDSTVQQLADAIALTLSDPDLRRRLGDAARVKVLREHSWTHYAEDMESLYLQVLRPFSGGLTR
jgi:starch synthase